MGKLVDVGAVTEIYAGAKLVLGVSPSLSLQVVFLKSFHRVQTAVLMRPKSLATIKSHEMVISKSF